jgi:hypothetical protein
MNTRTKGIAEEIRKALEAATPGLWTPVNGSKVGVLDEYGYSVLIPQNIDLIANAPTWLRSLLDENEHITKERDNLLEAVETICYHFPTPLGDDDYETAYDEVKSTAKKVYETINESTEDFAK